MKKLLVKVWLMAMVLGCAVGAPRVAWAAEGEKKSCAGVQTSVIECGDQANKGRSEKGGVVNGILEILAIVLNVLSYGIVVFAVLGVVLVGYMYLTSDGDPGKIKNAKARLLQIVIGLLVYSVMWALLQFLLPSDLEKSLQSTGEYEPGQETTQEDDQVTSEDEDKQVQVQELLQKMKEEKKKKQEAKK